MIFLTRVFYDRNVRENEQAEAFRTYVFYAIQHRNNFSIMKIFLAIAKVLVTLPSTLYPWTLQAGCTVYL